MSFDFMVLIAQTLSAFFLAAWLTTGVFENIFHSSLNSTFTAEVLEMTRMQDDYPEAFETVAYRRVENPKLQQLLFYFIVGWEALATLALWIGTGAMALAIFGWADAEVARGFGLMGALFFTSIWAGFLVAGNWFCYWFCHEGAQNTHYQMTLWGMATMLMLVAG
ncbi:hypothetical protein A9Q94_09335 [Rhodobacterales bacterium 56_14_T64]|nr:hypothetical protein A9Q94_09335 [Rhodobacterales bacterium 56_14_T64]